MATRIAVMNKGWLQQLDTPQNLYDRPANLFVAGFIGSPSMNFFPAKIRKDGSALFVDTGDFAVKVPDNRIGTYAGHTGKDVILGIRPEDIHNPTYAPPGISAAPVEAKVDVTELMGNEIFLRLTRAPASRWAITFSWSSIWKTSTSSIPLPIRKIRSQSGKPFSGSTRLRYTL